MPGMGPAPKDSSRRARRNPTTGFTQLPAEGRSGAAPEWPLRPDAFLVRTKLVEEERAVRLRSQINDTEDRRKLGRLERQLDEAMVAAELAEQKLAEQADRESTLWKTLWATPQAVMWERFRWTGLVAVFVRCQLRAEDGDMKAMTEARQRETTLGLNPKGMLQNRWTIVADEVGERRDDNADQPTGSRARRGPLKAVPSAKAAGSGG